MCLSWEWSNAPPKNEISNALISLPNCKQANPECYCYSNYKDSLLPSLCQFLFNFLLLHPRSRCPFRHLFTKLYGLSINLTRLCMQAIIYLQIFYFTGKKKLRAYQVENKLLFSYFLPYFLIFTSHFSKHGWKKWCTQLNSVYENKPTAPSPASFWKIILVQILETNIPYCLVEVNDPEIYVS